MGGKTNWNCKRGEGQGIKWLREHVSYRGDDCLPWPLSKDGRVGRGRVGWNGKHYWAHRLMCVLAHGEPPTPKHQTAHSCGKGHEGCVNPRHLSWQTNSENQLDRYRKHGGKHGNPNGQRGRVTREQIDRMRALKGKRTQVAIAVDEGVSLGTVQYYQKYRERRGGNRA